MTNVVPIRQTGEQYIAPSKMGAKWSVVLITPIIRGREIREAIENGLTRSESVRRARAVAATRKLHVRLPRGGAI